MAVLESKLIATLVDGITAPARAAGEALKGLGASTNATSSLSGRLGAALEQNQRSLERMHGNMLGAIAAGWALYEALSKPIEVASRFESAMTDIGIAAGLTAEQVDHLAGRLRGLPKDTNQNLAEVQQGFNKLVSMGLTPAQAEKIVSPVGRATTALHAAITDFSAIAAASFNNLKIPIDQTKLSLDIMTAAGINSKDEVAGFAESFPKLSAGAERLGMTGTKAMMALASAAVVGARATGDVGSATANLATALATAAKPETKKAFDAIGINLSATLAKTAAQGGDVFKMFLILAEKLKVANPKKFEEVFPSARGKPNLIDYLMRNYTALEQTEAKAIKGAGTIDALYERRMADLEDIWKSTKIGIEGVYLAIGDALIPSLKDLLTNLNPVINRFADWVRDHPGLVSAVVKISSAVLGATIGMTALGWAGRLVVSGIGPIARLGLSVGEAVASMVAPLWGAAAGAGALGGVLAFFGLAATLGAIALAGKFIADNWQGMGLGIEEFGKTFKAQFGPEDKKRFEPMLTAMKEVQSFFTSGSFKLDDSVWVSFGNAAAKVAAGGLKDVVDRINEIMAAVRMLKDALEWIDKTMTGGVFGKKETYDLTKNIARDLLPFLNPFNVPGGKEHQEALKNVARDFGAAWRGQRDREQVPAPEPQPPPPVTAQEFGAPPVPPTVAPTLTPEGVAVEPAKPAPRPRSVLFGWGTPRAEPPMTFPEFAPAESGATPIPEATAAPPLVPSPRVDVANVNAATGAIKTTNEELNKLNTTVNPVVTQDSIDTTLDKARELSRLLAQIGGTIINPGSIMPNGMVSRVSRMLHGANNDYGL